MGANRFVNTVYLLSRSVSLYPNKKYVTDRLIHYVICINW